MPYDANGEAYDPEPAPGLLKAVAAAVACILVVLLAAQLAPADAQPEPDEPAVLTIDTSDAALMHAYGLPSEADVIHWHVHGEWGYRDCNGNVRKYDELPGEGWRWDGLYGIKWRAVFQH